MKTILASLLMICCAVAAFAQSGYQVRGGDTLAIEVLEDPQLNRSVLVTPSGTFSFPFAGQVSAAGKTTDQIASELSASIASNFATTPNVFVSVTTVAPSAPTATGPAAPVTIDVFLVGEVNNPGPQAIERGTTFLQALAGTGGFTRFAATKRVQLRRTDPKTGVSRAYTFNFRALSNGAEFKDFPLQDGDIILVPERRLFE